MQQFISVLTTAGSDNDHIASRYAKLLHRLWFHSQQEEASSSAAGIANDLLGGQSINTGIAGTHMPAFDELAMQMFDYTDPMEGLFAMPSIFWWDQPGYTETPS